jgi:hypothetical protein
VGWEEVGGERQTQKVGGVRREREIEAPNQHTHTHTHTHTKPKNGKNIKKIRRRTPKEKSVLNHSCRSPTFSVAALPSGTAQVCAT